MKSPWKIRVEGSSSIDRTEVRRALALLVDPDASHEVRALPSGISITIHGDRLEEAVERIEAIAGHVGTYVTLNPVRSDLDRAARRDDICKINHMLLDCDRRSNNKKGTNATEEEKEQCRLVAEAMAEWLTGEGWPRPVVIDSGNGWHLIFRVDMPNSPLSTSIIKACLHKLSDRFSTNDVEIDRVVSNAARITKLPGTWTRKGPHSDDRPHRMARLVSIPKVFDAVSIEQLKTLAGMAEPTPTPEITPVPTVSWTIPVQAPGRRGVELYVEAAVDAECRSLGAAPDGNRNNTLNRAAFSLGQLVHFGVMDRRQIEQALTIAASECGLTGQEVERTIRSGLEAGLQHPREVEFRDATSTTAPSKADEIPAGVKLTIKASQITPKAVRWLWKDRVAVGFITIFAGRTGLGKSFVTCDLAARITQGEDLPDGPSGLKGEARSVLFISEDPYEYILAPRLLELGADMDRIAFLTWEAMAQYRLDDTGFLTRALSEVENPSLVVIDPPTNFLGDDIDEHKNSAVRGILMHIVQWVKDRDCAVILITHVSKSTGKGIEAINRVIGSVAWMSTARVGHAFTQDPDDPSLCLFLPLKNNLGPMALGLGYRIVKTDSLATVEWTGTVDTTADAAMNGEKRQPRAVIASEWLREQFRKRREWPSDELRTMAREAGVSKNALWSPEVQALPIDRRQIVNADGSRHWVWIAREGWPEEVP